jgi:hypothetical protein
VGKGRERRNIESKVKLAAHSSCLKIKSLIVPVCTVPDVCRILTIFYLTFKFNSDLVKMLKLVLNFSRAGVT